MWSQALILHFDVITVGTNAFQMDFQGVEFFVTFRVEGHCVWLSCRPIAYINPEIPKRTNCFFVQTV